eukprot:2481400-Rhodomonas_salina.1
MRVPLLTTASVYDSFDHTCPDCFDYSMLVPLFSLLTTGYLARLRSSFDRRRPLRYLFRLYPGHVQHVPGALKP